MQMQKLGNNKFKDFSRILYKDSQGLETEAFFCKDFQGCGNSAFVNACFMEQFSVLMVQLIIVFSDSVPYL